MLEKQNVRRVFIILSSSSLPYAEKCIDSLFTNSLESLNVFLITDDTEDKEKIIASVEKINNPNNHQWQVYDVFEADERAEIKFKQYSNLLIFRKGHPCWRKLTDPLLFSETGEEMIILDPDLYFPNRFKFEQTPKDKLHLMWQPPSCLLPPETVLAAFNAPVKLAHHVDIGVAQIREPIDLEWFDWLIGKLGGKEIPRLMHVEAIVWSAFAMKMGGGYLNPKHWKCWYRSHWKRVLIKTGMSGTKMLSMENLNSVKCFHACGMSKWWVKEAVEQKLLQKEKLVTTTLPTIPFTEFTLKRYKLEQNIKDFLWKIGYYSLINPD
ncbi:hypothetical protein VKI22_14320 [Cyanobacterium aponinum UTEX 3221]|uniref:Glycosyl transferase family 2 n=1 Tax=Cyanobacterium aponinum 0216 TaxID=2676140 RepID=A0A844GWA8_9CHRO|nr:hypothetical protein [Cyanobacterium aponinum]MTF39139.1 hypothetical protein [Cyanobacterium aponinum 0216]PHV62946.1 hypothetical protein CSQ80_07845 [Cyanobacterium aponinum IPPAS B-1201]WRL37783.1 hypothetical protein VKI22_14320 [Cyanobacterium aponinum UTEX 3221]